MKNKRFLWLPLLAIISFAGLYVISCQRDAESSETKTLSDTPLTERACGTDECLVTVTMDTDIAVDICGDIPALVASCTACGNNATGASGAMFEEDVPRELCVNENGNLCITNLSTNVSSVWVTVQFGSSTPVTAFIIPGQTHCFHTDTNCDTFDGCI